VATRQKFEIALPGSFLIAPPVILGTRQQLIRGARVSVLASSGQLFGCRALADEPHVAVNCVGGWAADVTLDEGALPLPLRPFTELDLLLP